MSVVKMLDGNVFLDGVKKRKSASSPGKESAMGQKKVRQTNRLFSADGRSHVSKICSSTPQQTSLSQWVFVFFFGTGFAIDIDNPVGDQSWYF